jgi:small subunit ribosomal protein S1
VGDDLEVKILRVDSEDRKIGLSRKRVEWATEDEAAAEAAEAEAAAGKELPADLKGGIGRDSGPLFKSPADMIDDPGAPAEPEAAAEQLEEAAESVEAAETES